MIYDEKNIEHINYYNNLKRKVNEFKCANINISLFKNYIKNVDLILVISDNIKETILQFDLITLKNSGIPIFVVTDNLSTKNVVESINFTPYIAYIKNNNTKVINRIINIVKLRKNEGS